MLFTLDYSRTLEWGNYWYFTLSPSLKIGEVMLTVTSTEDFMRTWLKTDWLQDCCSRYWIAVDCNGDLVQFHNAVMRGFEANGATPNQWKQAQGLCWINCDVVVLEILCIWTSLVIVAA